MDTTFDIIPLTAGFVFGNQASTVLTSLAARYQAEANIEAKHWAMWVFANGCTVPVPTQVDEKMIPPVRACYLLKLTLQQLVQSGVPEMDETDRFVLESSIERLEQLNLIAFASEKQDDQNP